MSQGTFYFRPLPVATQVCQATGITTSAFLAGYLASFSFAATAVSTLHDSPLSPSQWVGEAISKTSLLMSLTLIPTACFAYLAYQSRRKPAAHLPPASAPALYTAAACLVPALIPFSLLFTSATEASLRSVSWQTSLTALQSASIVASIDSWITLNYIRAILPALGSIFGITAVVIRPEVAAFAVTGKA